MLKRDDECRSRPEKVASRTGSTIPLLLDASTFISDDPAKGVVGAKVGTAKLRELPAAIHTTTRDAKSCRARILENGIDRMKIRRRHVLPGTEVEGMQSFAMTPPIVAACDDEIDLFIEILADITREEAARGRIKTEAPDVAQTCRPDLRAHGDWIKLLPVMQCGADEGIVRRHCVSARMHGGMRIWRQASGFLVHVEAQDRGVEVPVDEARVIEGIVRAAAVAKAGI